MWNTGWRLSTLLDNRYFKMTRSSSTPHYHMRNKLVVACSLAHPNNQRSNTHPLASQHDYTQEDNELHNIKFSGKIFFVLLRCIIKMIYQNYLFSGACYVFSKRWLQVFEIRVSRYDCLDNFCFSTKHFVSKLKRKHMSQCWSDFLSKVFRKCMICMKILAITVLAGNKENEKAKQKIKTWS